MPDCVSSASLDWALAHVERFGDTDVFPVPFEYEIIKAHWPPIRAHLASIDLATHEVSSPAKLMVPKTGGGYRAATQLDPLDSLLLTAAALEAAPQIETFRKPKAERIACAFRVEIDSNGQLFGADSGWKDYHTRAAELIETDKFKYVVCADISDYYNQASHHRVQNALSAAGVAEHRSKNIEQFLSRLNALHHSKGIPVGPTAGILLGEACLADVDVKLGRKKLCHVRYVDDFRIFCEDLPAADRALHDLSEYLFTAHRLSLHPGKTRILDVQRFQDEELFDPEQLELETKRDKLAANLKTLKEIGYGDLDEQYFDTSKIDLGVLRELFLKSVSGEHLNQGLARYALRKAMALRSRVFLDDALANLEKLSPVYRDVIRYLLKVGDRKKPERIGSALEKLLTDSRTSFLPFIQLWTVEAFCRQPALSNAERALDLAEASHPLVRDRLCAMTAHAYKMTEWVRERKENWNAQGPWVHRAILRAAAVLPPDERRHWVKSALGHPLMLTKSVATIVGAG